jgi:hypothetical protein
MSKDSVGNHFTWQRTQHFWSDIFNFHLWYNVLKYTLLEIISKYFPQKNLDYPKAWHVILEFLFAFFFFTTEYIDQVDGPSNIN